MTSSLTAIRQATTFFHQNIEGTGLCPTIAESFTWIRSICMLIDNYALIEMQDPETMQTYAVHYAHIFAKHWTPTLEAYKQVKFSVALARMLMQSREITNPVIDYTLTKQGEQYTQHMN